MSWPKGWEAEEAVKRGKKAKRHRKIEEDGVDLDWF